MQIDRITRHLLAALCMSCGMAAFAGEAPGGAAAKSANATTPGLSAAELAKLPHVLFAHELEDVPDRNIVVSLLDFPPAPAKAPPCSVHKHAGPAYVYVLKGTMKLG